MPLGQAWQHPNRMDEFAQADADMPLDAPGRRRLPVLLRRAWYGLNQAFRRRIAGMGLTPDQFTVIRTLLEAGPDSLTQKALANAMSSDPNTIASLLERMEANGLVQRQPHEKDRRANRVELLPLAREKYEAMRNEAIALQSHVLEQLPEAEREIFLVQLETIAGACRDLSNPQR
ncbi:MAG: MarR family winged helix-turn-helix transcriptional regulator [Verrucomicrobiota bacterium]|nr:MarR family winged helix-turn-helix transcriptional regulator [Verrucomicrobiota bacterium]